MSSFPNMLTGFETALTWNNFTYCFLGVFLGTAIGVLPGIGALAAISMLLPVSYYLDPASAIIMLAGVYYGAEYGGSTSSILLNLPGTPSNVVTCLDGHPMAKQGRAGVALFVTTIASFVGGTCGIIVLIVFSPAIVEVALSFGPAEYFAIMVFGLIAGGTIGQSSPQKGIAMVMLGLIFGVVGTDIESGTARYTLGLPALLDGISLVALAMGVFGVAEIIASISENRNKTRIKQVNLRSLIPKKGDLKAIVAPIFRGTGIGALFGALPGTGPAISAFISYSIEQRMSRTPERFGKGAIEGIAAPEASNNAAVQTAFIPTLTLGIPGTATMAIMLGVLIIHGITPGPRLMSDNPDVFWGLIASFWLGNILLLVLNIPLIRVWVAFLQIPYRFMFPSVMVLICVGVYSVRNSDFDLWLLLAFGVLGLLLRVLDFHPAPLLLGFVLGPMLEENLRRALVFSRGDFLDLVARPIAGPILAVSALILFAAVFKGVRRIASRGQARLDDDTGA